MDGQHDGEGIALLCTPEGVVREVLRDELQLAERLAPGRLLCTLVDESSRQACWNFLQAVQSRRAVCEWEMSVPIDGQLRSIFFAGDSTPGGLLIIGSTTRAGVRRLQDELLKINQDQVNTARTQLNELSFKEGPDAEPAADVYEQLTRLKSELTTAQRELATKSAELAQLKQQKNQFLGMAAHDLRNPLSVIVQFTEYLLEDIPEGLNEEHIEILRMIDSSSHFMLQLLSDLLDISRIESGKLELDRKSTDLIGFLKRNIAANRILAQEKRITIDLSHEVPQLELAFDTAKVEQVLNSLLSNAIRFSQPETTVKVRVSASNGVAVISVRDQGPGIPRDEQEQMFQPFHRTSVQATAGEKSTGLGLAIAKRIVEAHGGNIWLDSDAGRGSVFCVALPIHARDEAGPAPMS